MIVMSRFLKLYHIVIFVVCSTLVTNLNKESCYSVKLGNIIDSEEYYNEVFLT